MPARTGSAPYGVFSARWAAPRRSTARQRRGGDGTGAVARRISGSRPLTKLHPQTASRVRCIRWFAQMRQIANVTKGKPVDRTAAMVAGRGVEYASKKKVLTDEQDHPYLLKRVPQHCKDITGTRRGRLVCLGLSAEVNGRWACRCDCGKYVLRTARAITNERNSCDRCEQCRHLAHLRRTDEFRRLGYNATNKWHE